MILKQAPLALVGGSFFSGVQNGCRRQRYIPGALLVKEGLPVTFWKLLGLGMRLRVPDKTLELDSESRRCRWNRIGPRLLQKHGIDARCSSHDTNGTNLFDTSGRVLCSLWSWFYHGKRNAGFKSYGAP